MSLAPRLDIRQSQSLVMTPQLQQAIKLLTLSNLEIEAFIAEEVEKNPLLDATAVREVATPERPEREAPAGADELVAGTAPAEDRGLDLDYATESHQQDSVVDGGTGPDGGLSLNGASSGGLGGEDGPDWDSLPDDAPNLAEHLEA